MPAFRQLLKAASAGAPYSSAEFRIRSWDGRYLWCRIRATTQFDSEGRPIKAVGVITDIDAEKKHEQRLLEQAQKDSLTGLLNQSAARSRAAELIEGRRPEEIQALMILDLDNFKNVNDQYGHLCGDAVLTDLAACLKRQFRGSDVIGRIGGDEFAVFLSSLSQASDAGVKAGEILAAIAALPLNDLDASLKEIDRAIRDLRLRGIQMYSDVNGMPLDAEALYPIYEKMERYNLPILIHPKRSPALPDYPGEENSRYRAWTKLGWPVASSMAMFRLVYGGVMERFPNLKIVTHHCGGVIPYLAGRMEWNDDFNEMRMGHKDILFPHKPLEYFRRMYYDTANNGYPAGLRCGMDFAGIGKLVFATDLPFCNQKGLRLIRDSIAAVDALDLAPGDRRKVVQSNAVDLFRLPLSTFV